MSKPVISSETTVMGIYADNEFKQLTNKEQNYAYSFASAAWEGAKICYFQKSYESPALFMLLQLVFSGQIVEDLRDRAIQQLGSEADVKAILAYTAAVFNNCGNFKSFGDDKFIPDVSQDQFYKFIQLSNNYASQQDLIEFLWNDIKGILFSVEGSLEKLGFPPEGQTGYYSQNITKEEINLVDDFLSVLNLDPINSRVIKLGEDHYRVQIASITPSRVTHYYQKKRIDLAYGDFSPFLRRVSQHLQNALDYASNANQRMMLQKYIEHFTTGDINAFKDSQRSWVRDIGPIVETNIGFIESYMDPKQVRAEFEGFASLVNKEQSKVTQQFVERAADFLKLLPWPAEFEKDKFLKPDFTCLSILAFGCSGTPLGINIPNYDDIRQDEGFKNVYLSNCVPSLKPGKSQYLTEVDDAIIVKWSNPMMFHKVIFHELLGHGCGKMFQKQGGELNFDPETINPLTGQKISSHYGEKDTWMSVFQNLSNPYEECRADSVALFFSCFEESVVALQDQHRESWKELCIAQFVHFIIQGVQGLQFYNREAKKWGQAHINGRWVILQVLLEAGNNFVTVEMAKTSEGKDTVKILVDHDQCFTTGKEAMKNFLLKMQVYKSTADFKSASEMYLGYSQVNDKFLEIRDIIIANKQPRRLEVQGHLKRDFEGNFDYQKFPESFEGVISSFIARYPHFDVEMYNTFIENKKQNRPNL